MTFTKLAFTGALALSVFTGSVVLAAGQGNGKAKGHGKQKNNADEDGSGKGQGQQTLLPGPRPPGGARLVQRTRGSSPSRASQKRSLASGTPKATRCARNASARTAETHPTSAPGSRSSPCSAPAGMPACRDWRQHCVTQSPHQPGCGRGSLQLI